MKMSQWCRFPNGAVWVIFIFCFCNFPCSPEKTKTHWIRFPKMSGSHFRPSMGLAGGHCPLGLDFLMCVSRVVLAFPPKNVVFRSGNAESEGTSTSLTPEGTPGHPRRQPREREKQPSCNPWPFARTVFREPRHTRFWIP